MDNENTMNNEPVVAPGSNDLRVGDPNTPYPKINPSALPFLTYWADHPSERMWQALRNWSDSDFIFMGHMSNTKGGKDFAEIDGVKVYLEDTFNK